MGKTAVYAGSSTRSRSGTSISCAAARRCSIGWSSRWPESRQAVQSDPEERIASFGVRFKVSTTSKSTASTACWSTTSTRERRCDSRGLERSLTLSSSSRLVSQTWTWHQTFRSFLLTEPRMLFVSSSLVREIASHGGDIRRYVPEEAAAALLERYARKQ